MFSKLVVACLPLVPRSIIRRVSRRYIAGDFLADAIATVRALSTEEGACATVDVLGEFVESRDQALNEMGHCRSVLAAIEDESLVGTAGLSIKPTSLGLGIDYDFAYGNIRELALIARDRGIFMRIDMENTPYTDDTLKVYRGLRDEGIDNVGIVLQSMLRRSEQDIRDLADYMPDIRLCKGIYREREEVAWQGREEVRDSFKRLLRQILDGGMRCAIATHDDPLLDDALDLISERGLGPDDYEFQMLLGVREPRRREILAAGHGLRVYVPFGEDWYGYSSRRLKENPTMAGMIAKAVLLGQ
jgi:proline dehydrogenase